MHRGRMGPFNNISLIFIKCSLQKESENQWTNRDSLQLLTLRFVTSELHLIAQLFQFGSFKWHSTKKIILFPVFLILSFLLQVVCMSGRWVWVQYPPQSLGLFVSIKAQSWCFLASNMSKPKVGRINRIYEVRTLWNESPISPHKDL